MEGRAHLYSQVRGWAGDLLVQSRIINGRKARAKSGREKERRREINEKYLLTRGRKDEEVHKTRGRIQTPEFLALSPNC